MDFWEKAVRALSWMERDEVSASIIRQIEWLIIDCCNIQEAAKECTVLKSHVSVFKKEHTDMVLAAVMIYLLPITLKKMEALEIPVQIRQDTLRDFSLWSKAFREETGRDGIWEVEWNLLFMAVKILRIGRLQFERTLFNEPFYAYQGKKEKDIVLLAADSLDIREDGRIQGTNGNYTENGYTTVLKAENGILTGNPADLVNGTVLNELVVLDLTEYDLLLAPGMPVINIHIPADGPLTPESVEDSIAQAEAYFASVHDPHRVGVCLSWLADPTLGCFLPENSNICRFMRCFDKFPLLCKQPAGITRVFGKHAGNSAVSDLPERTSLQRNLKRYLLEGGEIFDTGGFLSFSGK